MILRRYGTTVQSVEVDFNSKAMTEVGFRRDEEHSVATEEFESSYSEVSSHALVAEAEGDVHDTVEQALLDDLEAQLRAVVAGMDDGDVLCVPSAQDSDYPKTRTRTQNVVVGGQNRLYFYASIDPPLRVGVYRKS